MARQEQDFEEKLQIMESKQYRQRRQEQLSTSLRSRPAKTRRIDDEDEDDVETDVEDSEVNLDDDECPSCMSEFPFSISSFSTRGFAETE